MSGEVIASNGSHGTLCPAQQYYGRGCPIQIRWDDGGQLVVPARYLVRRSDGKYLLQLDPRGRRGI